MLLPLKNCLKPLLSQLYRNYSKYSVVTIIINPKCLSHRKSLDQKIHLILLKSLSLIALWEAGSCAMFLCSGRCSSPSVKSVPSKPLGDEDLSIIKVEFPDQTVYTCPVCDGQYAIFPSWTRHLRNKLISSLHLYSSVFRFETIKIQPKPLFFPSSNWNIRTIVLEYHHFLVDLGDSLIWGDSPLKVIWCLVAIQRGNAVSILGTLDVISFQ